MDSIILKNNVKEKKGRWYNYPEKPYLEQKFIIDIDKAIMLYEKDEVSNEFNLKITMKSLVTSPVIDEVPHAQVDKSMHLNISSKDLLRLSLTQEMYNYYMRCQDLNFNFNDEMQHKYVFKNFIDLDQLEMNEEAIVSQRMTVKLKNLSLTLLNPDKSYIAEMFYNNFKVSIIDKGRKEINLTAEKFFILDRKHQETKQVVLAPQRYKNILTEHDLMKKSSRKNSYNMEIVNLENGDKSIVWTIENSKVFIKLYTFRKIADFFTGAVPDYDHSVDKPNGYYKRNGELSSKDPSSRMTLIIDLKKSNLYFTNDVNAERIVI